MKSKANKLQYILIELGHHLPFSIFGVTLGLILMGLVSAVAILMRTESLLPVASYELFHIFHPAHVLLSAVATTAMFWKHEKHLIKAVIVGFLGAVITCSMSDILFPFWGGVLLNQDMAMHICIIEEPSLVYPFVVVGVLAGLFIPNTIEKSTEYSHSAHVFVSSVASILYLIAFGVADWMHVIGGVFVITVIAVMIPCCASDIAFPICCSHKGCQHEVR